MKSIGQYEDMIREVLGGESRERGVKLEWSYETVPEAKAMIKNMRLKQKELRHIKTLLNEDIKAIRQSYAGKIEGAGPGLAGLFVGKGRAASMRANEKRKLVRTRDNEIAPYTSLKLNIDRILLQLDQVKAELESYIEANK